MRKTMGHRKERWRRLFYQRGSSFAGHRSKYWLPRCRGGSQRQHSCADGIVIRTNQSRGMAIGEMQAVKKCLLTDTNEPILMILGLPKLSMIGHPKQASPEPIWPR